MVWAEASAAGKHYNTDTHSRVCAKRSVIRFNILAACLNILSAFGTALLVHFHPKIPKERGE